MTDPHTHFQIEITPADIETGVKAALERSARIVGLDGVEYDVEVPGQGFVVHVNVRAVYHDTDTEKLKIDRAVNSFLANGGEVEFRLDSLWQRKTR